MIVSYCVVPKMCKMLYLFPMGFVHGSFKDVALFGILLNRFFVLRNILEFLYTYSISDLCFRNMA